MKCVKKWTVPIDGNIWEIGGGPVVHLEADEELNDIMYVWTTELKDNPVPRAAVRIVRTEEFFNLAGDIAASVRAHGEMRHLVRYWQRSEEWANQQALFKHIANLPVPTSNEIRKQLGIEERKSDD